MPAELVRDLPTSEVRAALRNALGEMPQPSGDLINELLALGKVIHAGSL